MKTIKPQKLGVLHRTFEARRRSYLAVTVFGCFPFDAPRALVTEVDMWKTLGAELGEGAVLDEGWSKVRGEVLVTGSCFPPGGIARAASYVRLALGPVDKRLAVLGDRSWRGGVPTEPVPFTEMPVDWAHAFGGEGFEPNPAGKGFAPVGGAAGDAIPLPNVEPSDRLVRSPGDRPAPASFAALGLASAQRRARAGTYDRAWLESLSPGFPADTDPSFFNTAPEDQWLAGWFKGDEAFVLENMHPSRPWIESRLPGLAARVFINQKTEGGEALRELSTRIDTVRLFPRSLRGLVVFRGIIEVAEDDAADVLQLIVACEDPAAPKPVSHYREVLARRLDKKKGAFAALRDADLMPAAGGGLVPVAGKTDVEVLTAGEDLLRKNMRRRHEAEHRKLVARLEAQGLRPADHGVKPLPDELVTPAADDPDALEAFAEEQLATAERERAAAEAKKAEVLATTRKQLAAQGVDLDALMAEARGGPPAFPLAEQLATLPPEVRASRPDLAEKVQRVEQQLHAAYRLAAHHQPPAATLEPEVARWRGDALVAAVTAGEKVAGRDFTGVDLRGRDLRGLSLAGVFLEGADLAGANLGGANLSGAVLARASLTGTKLVAASLTGANLGGARLAGADLSDADLSRAILAKAEVGDARFKGATLTGADLLEARFDRTDLSGVVAAEIRLLQVDLTGVRFAGARLTKAVFLEAELSGADFTGAELGQASFITSKGEGVVFRKASLKRAVFAHGTSLPGADFRGATLDGATLRGTHLDRADFSAARFEQADLSECSLREAAFVSASGPRAMMVRADLTGARMAGVDLMEAILQKARLGGANLSDASLFRADLTRVVVDGKTKLDRALLTSARVHPRSRDGSK